MAYNMGTFGFRRVCVWIIFYNILVVGDFLQEIFKEEIHDLEVREINSTSFHLYWIFVPERNYEYNVTIQRNQPGLGNHYWRKSCASGMNESEFSVIVNVTNLFVDQILPDFVYAVNVALKIIGSGSETLTLTTLPAASDKPENVKYEIYQTKYTKNIIREIRLVWEMPCNTNGPVDLFFIKVDYFYIDSGDNMSSNVTFKEFIGSKNGSDIFNYTIKDVSAASNYSLSIYAAGNTTEIQPEGKRYKTIILTNDNYPSQPETVQSETSPNNLTLFWKEPSNKPGKIISYKVKLNFLVINWIRMPACNLNTEFKIEKVTKNIFSTTNIISGASYDIDISAQTSIGWGNSTSIQLNSSISEPGAIKNITLGTVNNESAILYFTPGCFFGAFESYYIQYKEARNGQILVYHPVKITDYNMTSLTLTNILPEMGYEVNVTVSNLEFHKTSTAKFKTPSIPPLFNMTNIKKSVNLKNISNSQVVLTLHKETFTNYHNPLLYMAIIISDRNQTDGEINQWNRSVWPLEGPKNESVIYYQATEKFYNPFADKDTVHFVLGVDKTCYKNQENCNAPLQPGATYYVFFRLFNNQYYKNTMPLLFVTDKTRRVSLMVGFIFGFLFITVLVSALILWRMGIIKKLLSKIRAASPVKKTDISQAEFIRYCCYLEEHFDVLERQWLELQAKSLEIYDTYETSYAVLPENKLKNRYPDILPFDLTRVQLNIDKDDEICSDYINASYIKGFSNTIEYIATQGPLSHTATDFWKMVIQENISIIVMVARFYENKMEKCYKYFPNNHEMLLFGDNIEVRCTTELNLNTYFVRTLEARMGSQQLTVIHMQFLEWPDFDVPVNGPDNLLYFYHQFRERWDAEGDFPRDDLC